MTIPRRSQKLAVILALLSFIPPWCLRNFQATAQIPTFGVGLAGATHRTHVDLTNQHVVDGTVGLAVMANVGLRWGPLTMPDFRVAFLTLAGLPYHAYSAGIGLGRPKGGIRGRIGVGLIQRPVQWDPIDSGDSFYTTRNRFGIAAEFGYQLPVRRRWSWAPTLSWTSTLPEGDLKWRFELISVGVTVSFR